MSDTLEEAREAWKKEFVERVTTVQRLFDILPKVEDLPTPKTSEDD